MLCSTVKDPVTSANDLNHDLDMIYQWAHQRKIEFNPDPIKQATEVLFSCKKNSVSHPQLYFNGSAVVKVNDQKHLGLTLEPGLSFEKHLSEKIIKAKKNIGILKHLSKFSLRGHLIKCIKLLFALILIIVMSFIIYHPRGGSRKKIEGGFICRPIQ